MKVLNFPSRVESSCCGSSAFAFVCSVLICKLCSITFPISMVLQSVSRSLPNKFCFWHLSTTFPKLPQLQNVCSFSPHFSFATKKQCLTELTVTSGARRRAFSSFRTISPLLCRMRSLPRLLPLQLRFRRWRKVVLAFLSHRIHRRSRPMKCRLPIVLAQYDPLSFRRRRQYEIN